jgi:hypothetical protein
MNPNKKKVTENFAKKMIDSINNLKPQGPTEPKKRRFTVAIERNDGAKLFTIRNIEAQTKFEAINKIKDSFVFTAGRSS